MILLQDIIVSHATIIAASFVVALWCYSRIRSLYSNIAAARSTGFVYFVLPFSIFDAHWEVLQPFILPLLSLLPNRWTERWFS